MGADRKKDIRSLSAEELTRFFEERNAHSFRGKQVYKWLWQKGSTHFDEMTDLPIGLRDTLKENFSIPVLRVGDRQESRDGTFKLAFHTEEGHVVEGVLIPDGARMTACVSSQIGCSLACDFCATAALKRKRNLGAGEILDQVWHLNEIARNAYGHHLSNIVYMGMGEPLMNYGQVIRSITGLTGSKGWGMAPGRITVSTVGVAKMIERLADEGTGVNLALSLHVANDEKRDGIMDINHSNNTGRLLEALQYFNERTGSRITLEYIIFHRFNDEVEDARELAEFAKQVPSKVNIIEYNPIEGGCLRQADKHKARAFVDTLEEAGIIVRIRRSRGKDIDAACGQLANKNNAISEKDPL